MSEQTARQPTEKLTLRIPVALHEQARRKARAARRSLNRYIVEAVEQRIEQAEPGSAYLPEDEGVLTALKQSGMLARAEIGWDGLLSERPLKTHDEILRMMAGQRPLACDVIEMRGEL